MEAYGFKYMFIGFVMDAISYTAARANLAQTMKRVCSEHEPLIIIRNGEQSVVMISLEDYQSLEETTFLLRSPVNAKRLIEAIGSLADGHGREQQLLE
jgi:antitoxin YefM